MEMFGYLAYASQAAPQLFLEHLPLTSFPTFSGFLVILNDLPVKYFTAKRAVLTNLNIVLSTFPICKRRDHSY